MEPRDDERAIDAVINGVDEVERDVRARVDTLLKRSEEPPTQVLTVGLDLEDKDKERVET